MPPEHVCCKRCGIGFSAREIRAVAPVTVEGRGGPQTLFAPVPANQSLATNEPLAAPAASPPNTPSVAQSPLYLIALKDGVIHAGLSYHVDGGTLRYTAFGGGRKEVPLDQVDRGLSEELTANGMSRSSCLKTDDVWPKYSIHLIRRDLRIQATSWWLPFGFAF
jgi:hypothetical protein